MDSSYLMSNYSLSYFSYLFSVWLCDLLTAFDIWDLYSHFLQKLSLQDWEAAVPFSTLLSVLRDDVAGCLMSITEGKHPLLYSSKLVV